MSGLKCPKCQQKMDVFEQVGVEIDQCNSCGGVWLDRDEWTKITRGRGQDALQLSVINRTATGLPCPRCSHPLEMGSHSEQLDFIIDYCGNCGGSFFDQGELARLLAR